jgi:hypothetical protein
MTVVPTPNACLPCMLQTENLLTLVGPGPTREEGRKGSRLGIGRWRLTSKSGSNARKGAASTLG